MRKFFLLAVAVVFSISADAYEVVFTNQVSGIPSGWQLLGNGNINVIGSSKDPDGREMGLCFSFGSTAGSKIFGTTAAVIPNGEISCDRVYARIRLYQQTEYFRQDSFQVVISTNNWENYPDPASYQAIGDPIKVEEPGRTVREWVTFERQLLIPGLSESGNDVSVGVLATAAGTARLGYWQSLDLRFVAAATPQNICFEVGGNEVASLEPGESNAIVSATINEYPSDGDEKVTVSGVKCILERNDGLPVTNDMTRVGTTSRWETRRISPAIEAGEYLKASVVTEYTSKIDTLGKKDAQGVAREQSDWFVIEGAKKGSVWINEFSLDQVELCGTANRVMFEGWWLELSNLDSKIGKADLSGLFDFKRNMINGVVGLETRGLVWVDSAGTVMQGFESGNYTLRLHNSAGIVEHEVAISLPQSGSSGMTGCAVWKGLEYDWTGTATNHNVFTWKKLSECSFGKVNDGQGFKVPVSAELIIDTESQSGSPLSYVTVIATATNLLNTADASAITNFPAQSEDGVAHISICGYSATPEKIHIDLAASAFGWISNPKSIDLADSEVSRTLLQLSPTIATDDFEGADFKSFWVKEGTKTWELATQDGRRCLRLNSSRGDGGTAVLRCSNFLSPRGRKYASVSFDYRNWYTSSPRHDYFHVELSTNGDWQGNQNETIVTPTLTNNVHHVLGDYVWYRHQVVVEMPEEFACSDEIWIRLVCESMGSTMTYTHVDNLRIAFEDVALPTNLLRAVEKPASGGSTGFELDVLPQTADVVKEVSADLHITVAGDKRVVPFAFADGSLTNRISIADGDGAPSLPSSTKLTISPESLEKVCGKFYAGQTVTYYAAVHYNSANGDTMLKGDTELEGLYQTRYFPDNAKVETIETADGKRDYWVVEGDVKGPYKALEDQYTFTVDGPDIEILGEPRIDVGEIGFDYHAWDRTGNKGITNLMLTVEADGFSTNYVMFAGDATNRVTDAFVVPDLAANTTYKLTLSGQRNTRHDLTSTNYTFTTLGEVKSAKIVGTSKSGVELTVDGLAEKYIVEPSDWVQEPGSTTVWTWDGGLPNAERTATIKAVNSAGMTNEAAFVVSGYTLAAKPTEAPVVEQPENDNVVIVQADEDYAKVTGGFYSDGNPSNTEYAVRVKTSRGNDSAYVADETGAAIWKTLVEWAEAPVTTGAPVVDLTATNTFRFVARNGDGIVAEEDGPESEPHWFDRSVGFVDNAAHQATFPFEGGLYLGAVAFTNVFFEPATSKQVNVVLEYQLGDEIREDGWQSACSAAAIDFDELRKTNSYVWNAREMVVGNVKTSYHLRATISKDDRSATAVIGGMLDLETPTITTLACAAHYFNTSSMEVTVAFSEPVVDFSRASLVVDYGSAGDPTPVEGRENTYKFIVRPNVAGPGIVQPITVQIPAGTVHDVFGNANAAAANVSFTYDTKLPTNLAIEGYPEEGVATNGTQFAFKASALDDAQPLTYYWTWTNDVAIVGQTFEDFAVEGTNTVSVYAVDAAGNACAPTNRTWVVDMTPPEIVDWSGQPASPTKAQSFRMTATVKDNLTRVKCHWKLDAEAETECEEFVRKNLSDGSHTVWLYATDEAGNASETNSYSWIVDNVAPDNLKIEGTPAVSPFVTTVTEVYLTASATDDVTPKDKIDYTWDFNGLKSSTTALLDTTAQEGTNTAKVVATDEAGNPSELTRTWVVDTHSPTNLVISGTPAAGAFTNEAIFAYTATAMDDTRLTFHWKFDNGEEVKKNAGEAFTENDLKDGTAFAEGEHEVSVYAEDEAENVSATNSVRWTYDVTSPEVVVLSGEKTPDPFGKGTEFLEVEVAFNEPVVGFCKDSVFVDNKAQVASVTQTDTDGAAYFVQIRPGDDGKITVKIDADMVTDRAGNGNVASGTLTHTYDTTPPTDFTFASTPKWKDVVTTSNFQFAVSATDTTEIVYHWKTNQAAFTELNATKDDKGYWVANFAGLASEGTNTLSVYGTDQLGNPTVTNSIWWVVDTIAPTVPVIEGAPADGAYTNATTCGFTAKSQDKTILKYFWKLDNGAVTQLVEGVMFEGKDLAGDPPQEHTVTVYAKDEAGNTSGATNWTWTVDTVHPRVAKVETIPTSDRFNRAAAPLKVTVTFSEEVTDFDKGSLNIVNGKIDGDVTSGEEANSYTFKVEPNSYNETTSVVEEVSIRIVKEKVHDRAGNETEAWELTKIYDTTTPIIELTSRKTPDPFNKDFTPMKVNIVISGKNVTTLSVDSICVTNGNIVAGSFEETTEKTGVNPAEKRTYELEVNPAELKSEALITVAIPEGVVTNAAGTVNEPDKPLTLMYDNLAPRDLKISGAPEAGQTTSSRSFEFVATATDSTALTYKWWLNKQNKEESETPDCTTSNYVSKALVMQGTNWVSVMVTDAAGNRSAIERRMWIVDFIPPYDFTLTGKPGNTNEDDVVVTKVTEFDYKADAKDDFSTIIYHWNTNSVELSDHPTNVVSTAGEGTNTVTVWAEDIANNVCPVTNRIVWVVDRTPPTLLGWSGLPEKFTTATDLSLTATASDNLTQVTYHWTFDTDKEQKKDGEAFVRNDLADGEHTVSVYVTDEAENVSTKTNSWTWTVDTHAPTELAIDGEPADGSVTSNRVFWFEARSEDLTDVSYNWTLRRGEDTASTGEGKTFSGTVAEGYDVCTVMVSATDKAGNVSSTNWTWTLDTIAPTNLTLRGLPISDEKIIVTNGYFFAFTASAEDATAITYHWATNGVVVTDCTSSNFVGYVSEGTNTVSVYAMDAASNVCKSVERTWVVDTEGPSRPKIGGRLTDKSVTNDCEFYFEASATDDWSRTIDFHWSLKRGEDTASTKEGTGPTFTDKFKDDGTDDGSYTVSVWAIDEAGNVSPTNSLSWTLDTIAPKMPVIVDASPASNSFVNVTNYYFKAAEPEGEKDATTVTFFWTLGEGDPPVGRGEDTASTNFTGEVEKDGAYTAFVYAKDAAGNVSPTNSLSWTVDTQIPTNLVISGWPANGSLTNGPNYCLTATADDATTLTYHWTIDDAAGVSDLSKDKLFEGKVADGTHTVSCYATDAAQNRSATKFWSWTSDTTGPTNLVLSVGTPSEGAVVATNGYDFTVSAMDLSKITYSWTLNGNKSEENTTSNLVGTAAIEGTNTLSVTAVDAAGNPSEETRTRTWVVDTLAPTNLVVTGMPGDGALTNGTYFAWTASAQDATRLTYHWSLLTNGVEAVTGIETNEFSDVAVEGTNTVTVYARDEAGNVSETTNVCWTVDLTHPTVTLSTDLKPEGKVINLADVAQNGFKVMVEFSEPVVGFSAASVTITNDNGMVTAVKTNDNNLASYAVWVMPKTDYEGLLPLQIAVGAVKDRAGNGNVLATLDCACDVKQPKVLSLKSNKAKHFKWAYLQPNDYFEVTVTFDEAVTSFTASSVRLEKCAVKKVIPDSGYAESYTLYLEPSEGTNTIQIVEGGVMDRAGNGNVVSDCLKLVYDNTPPTKPGLDGVPANLSRTQERAFRVMATNSTDLLQISYRWVLDGVLQEWTTNSVLTGSVGPGEHTVKLLRLSDELSNQQTFEDLTWTWTVESDTPSGNVDFGGGVYLKVDPETHETNVVRFTAVDFHPGEDSTITMSGFGVDPLPPDTLPTNIKDLGMNLRVCDTLDGERWTVQVKPDAYYDKSKTPGELTVTIPETGARTKDGDPVEPPYKTFFVFGVENIEEK